jgi:hypothetical protein
MSKIYAKSSGITIINYLDRDISNVTEARIYYKKPSGATGYWVADIDVGNRAITYIITNELDEGGRWKFQPYIAGDGFIYYGSVWSQWVENSLG